MIETELWNETFMHVYLGLLSLNSKLSPYFLQILIFFSIIYCLNLLICLLLICCLIFTVLITIKCIYWREGLVKTEMERKPTVRNGRGCLEKAMATHPSTLAWQIPWTEEPGSLQSMGSQSDFTFSFHFYALEKEMATHSSVLAWRIPGTGEPDGLLSLGSYRVGHNWGDLAAAATAV